PSARSSPALGIGPRDVRRSQEGCRHQQGSVELVGVDLSNSKIIREIRRSPVIAEHRIVSDVEIEAQLIRIVGVIRPVGEFMSEGEALGSDDVVEQVFVGDVEADSSSRWTKRSKNRTACVSRFVIDGVVYHLEL